jgi:hypothetical protein
VGTSHLRMLLECIFLEEMAALVSFLHTTVISLLCSMSREGFINRAVYDWGIEGTDVLKYENHEEYGFNYSNILACHDSAIWRVCVLAIPMIMVRVRGTVRCMMRGLREW